MSGMRAHLLTIFGCSLLIPPLFLGAQWVGLSPQWAVALFGFLTLAGGVALGYFMPSWSIALPMISGSIFFYPHPDYVISYPAVQIVLLAVCLGFILLSYQVIVRNFTPKRRHWIIASMFSGHVLADSMINTVWYYGHHRTASVVSALALITLIIFSDRGEKAAQERGARILRSLGQ